MSKLLHCLHRATAILPGGVQVWEMSSSRELCHGIRELSLPLQIPPCVDLCQAIMSMQHTFLKSVITPGMAAKRDMSLVSCAASLVADTGRSAAWSVTASCFFFFLLLFC